MPTPPLPKLILPGSAFALARYSASVVIGLLPRTASTIGTSAIRLIAVSWSGSNGRFEYSAGAIEIEEVVNSSVWPSGAAWATADAPIEPPAPPRFSRMNVPLVCAPSRSFISRAGTSTGPPAANGTMTRTALDGGHSWAVAAGAETSAATISAEADSARAAFIRCSRRRPSPARPICRSRH